MSSVTKTYKKKKSFEYDKKRMEDKGYYISSSTIYLGELKVEYNKKKKGVDPKMFDDIKKDIVDEVNKRIEGIKKNGIRSYDAGFAAGLHTALYIMQKSLYNELYNK